MNEAKRVIFSPKYREFFSKIELFKIFECRGFRDFFKTVCLKKISYFHFCRGHYNHYFEEGTS